MKLFDLHCDTITECSIENKKLLKNDLHISIKGAQYLNEWVQLFAIWMPDDYRGEQACQYFENIYHTYNEQMNKNKKLISKCTTGKEIEQAIQSGKFASVLTVEGGSAIAGDLDRIDYLYDLGVRLVTLTWNGSNEIANGCMSKDESGLTSFGKDAVLKMHDLGIIVDVSHLNDAGFYDVAQLSQDSGKPFIATHSNSDFICAHKRNLTNEQINIIIENGGLIGINLFWQFVGADSCDFVYRHIYHMLSLGAQNTIAMGSDFDGCTTVTQLSGIDKMPILYDYLLSRNIEQKVVDAIFFDNAYNFFINNLS